MSVVVVVFVVIVIVIVVVVIVTVPSPLLMILQSRHFHTGRMWRGTRCRTAHFITPAQATVPSSEFVWDEFCARDGETDRPQTCHPRWHGPAAVAHQFSQLRLSRATRTWNHQRFWQRGVLRTRRPTPFCLRFRALRRLPTVRAPDQRQQGTMRLKKSRVFSRNVHHRPQCTRSQPDETLRGHEESVHKGLDVRLGTGSFLHHLNQLFSDDGKRLTNHWGIFLVKR